ncbi:MAG: hypothetical protein GX971_04420 [Firmicutes bacterium]|nr:hypothetical protein [Bacillota bacterium]
MERAARWIKRYARPLETVQWEFFFEQGPKEKVLGYLSAFQNEDGGFGNGLEPDFWLPSSSPMASSMAGRILDDINADSDGEIIVKFKTYLINTSQVEPGMWASTLPENNLHPHAPWWHWQQGGQGAWMFNPSVELASFLIKWSSPESSEAELGWFSLGHAMQRLKQAETMERHEVKCYRHSLRLLADHKTRFNAVMGWTFAEAEDKVQELTKRVIDKDVDNWKKGYKPLPLDFIHSPADPLYLELKTLVEQNLDFFLEKRTSEGIWEIPWSWGQYPNEFSIARRYWQGILALERYRILKAFGWL